MVERLSEKSGLDASLTPALSPANGVAYDQFVATAPAGHYTQTRAWASVAAAGRPFQPLFFLAQRGGAVVGAGLVLQSRLGPFRLPFAQVERGPIATLSDMPEVLAALRRVCLARGIVRLSVMPYRSGDEREETEKTLRNERFNDFQRAAGRHVRTLRIDLNALDAANPFGGSTLSKVRQNIGRAERAGATVRRGRREDLAAYRTLNQALLAQEGRSGPAAAWYEAIGDYILSEGAMFVCEHGGKVISAILITRHGGMATYALGASSGDPLKFSKTVLPMTEAILWARAAGAHSFDLGGVPMAGDAEAKRISIAEFKYSYSRTEIDLVYEHVRWF